LQKQYISGEPNTPWKSGHSVLPPHAVSPIELKTRQFLRDRFRLSPGLRETAVRINEWTSLVLKNGLDGIAKAAAQRKSPGAALDVIEHIAESLVADDKAPTHELLSKSLQETLLYCTGMDPDLSYAQMKTRLMTFLKRRGGAAVVRRFLTLSLFNVIWFRTGDAFRGIARTPATYERDMLAVEQFCRRIAASCWRSQNLSRRPLDAEALDDLIRGIERRVRQGDRP
jgi:hypothetical protein